jgi:hypothetical protein
MFHKRQHPFPRNLLVIIDKSFTVNLEDTGITMSPTLIYIF